MSESMERESEKNISKKEYIEIEFKKWQQEFIIPFEKEFTVKALLDLQWSYMVTDSTHTKTKGDLIHSMLMLQRDLNLKKKTNVEGKPKQLLIAIKSSVYSQIELFCDIIGEQDIIKKLCGKTEGLITTNEYNIIFESNLGHLRGRRYDIYLNLTGDSNFDEFNVFKR